jgi:WD40 repeat protein
VNCLEFSDDASLLLAGSRAGSLHLWKSPTLGPLAGEWTSSAVLKAHAGDEFNTGIIKAVSLHPDKRWCATGSSDWDVKTWDVETQQNLSNGKSCGSSTSCHSAAIRDIAISK